jgi:hypothetical protein
MANTSGGIGKNIPLDLDHLTKQQIPKASNQKPGTKCN